MMNEEIKALMEAEKYADDLRAELDNCDTSELISIPYEELGNVQKEFHTSVFADGAFFAVSLFRWRKVSEELPKDNKKVIIRTNLNDLDIAYLCRDVDGIYFSSDCGSEFTLREIREWMPIPQ